jgi:hypothetical protein
VRAIDAVGNVGDPVVRAGAAPRGARTPDHRGAPTGTVRERTASPSFTADGATRFECAVDSTAFEACNLAARAGRPGGRSTLIAVRGVGAGGTAAPCSRGLDRPTARRS